MDTQTTLLVGALIVGAGLIVNAVSRGFAVYITALATAKAKEVTINVDDAEQRNKLDVQGRELLQKAYSGQAETLARLGERLAVLEHQNGSLEAQQKINIERLTNVTDEFAQYRIERHAADNELAKKLSDSEQRAFQASASRDASIKALQDCLDRADNASKKDA